MYCTPFSSPRAHATCLDVQGRTFSKTYGNCFFSILNILHIGPKTWHSYINALLSTRSLGRESTVGAVAPPTAIDHL